MQTAMSRCPSFIGLDALGVYFRIRRVVTSGGGSREVERHAEPRRRTPATISAARRRRQGGERVERRGIGDAFVYQRGRS
jgi:hypothetical protein